MRNECAVTAVDPLDMIHDLELRVRAQLGSRVRQLALLPREDGIVLRGIARTYHAKQLAQHAVMASIGYRVASNEIEVLASA
jgi:hypothetical protein